MQVPNKLGMPLMFAMGGLPNWFDGKVASRTQAKVIIVSIAA